MNNELQIKQLLESYYEGTTDSSDEMRLYMLLSGLPAGHPYEADQRLLEAMLCMVSDTSAEPSVSSPWYMTMWQAKSWRYGVAAALLVLVTVGVWNPIGWGSKQRYDYADNGSYYNGVPMEQKMVDQYANEAFEQLSDCFGRCADENARAYEVLDGLDARMSDSFGRLSEVEGGFVNVSF